MCIRDRPEGGGGGPGTEGGLGKEGGLGRPLVGAGGEGIDGTDEGIVAGAGMQPVNTKAMADKNKT